jgi:hypothetical protein
MAYSVIASMGYLRNGCIILVGKPECERQLGTYRSKADDNIKTDIREIGLEVVDLTTVAQVRDL